MWIGVLSVAIIAAAVTEPQIVPTPAKDGTPGVVVTFDVDAPAAAVLEQLLWDVSRFRQIFPDIKAVTVVGGSGTRLDVRFDVDAVIASPTYTLRRTLDVATREIRWHSIDGDVKHIAGRWQVEPLGPDRCRVRYESFVDVGVPGLSVVYRDVVVRKLDQMVARVRQAAALLPRAAPSSTPDSVPLSSSATTRPR